MNDNEASAQDVRDAIALATLLQDAQERGAQWTEALEFAQDKTATRGATLTMAQTHLLLQALNFATQLVNEWPVEHVELEGVDRPTSPLALLQVLGQDAAGD